MLSVPAHVSTPPPAMMTLPAPAPATTSLLNDDLFAGHASTSSPEMHCSNDTEQVEEKQRAEEGA